MNDKVVESDLDILMKRLNAGDATAMSDIFALTSSHLYGIIARIVATDRPEILKRVYVAFWTQQRAADRTVKADFDSALSGSALDQLRALAHRFALDQKLQTRSPDNIVPPTAPQIDDLMPRLYDLSPSDMRLLVRSYLDGASSESLARENGFDAQALESRFRSILTQIKGKAS